MRRVLPYFAVLLLAGGLGAVLTLGRPPPVPATPEGVESSPEEVPVIEAPLESAPRAPAPSVSAASAPPAAPDCPAGMALVEGDHCSFLAHKCAERAGPRGSCKRFGSPALCDGPAMHRRFCIDVHEYPNRAGSLPAVGVDFDDAASACAIEGKRLCTNFEWALACESTRMLPMPRGLRVDGAACPVDRTGGRPLPGAAMVAADYRSPSGAHPACASAFGVHDLAGNVEEWVENPLGSAEASPFTWAVAGGHAARGSEVGCRAIETDRSRGSRTPTLGFRCCADGKGGGKRAEREKPGRRGPRPVDLRE